MEAGFVIPSRDCVTERCDRRLADESSVLQAADPCLYLPVSLDGVAVKSPVTP